MTQASKNVSVKSALYDIYGGVNAYEISDIIITAKDIRQYDVLKSQESLWENSCIITKEAKPRVLTIQTQLLYDKPEMYEQIMGKVEKRYANLKCESGSSSIIYLKFNDTNTAKASYDFLKGLIWGEGGRSKRHPERLGRYGNIIAIFSSERAGMIDYLQLGKIIYSNVPSDILSTIRAKYGCDKPESEEYCQALLEIPKYKASPFPKSFSDGVFAKVWNLKPGKGAESSYMYGKVQNGKIGMRDVSPDNDRERAEMDAMMKGTMPPTKELLQFVASLKMEYLDLEKYQGSYRTTLGGNLISLYPIGKKVYFIVTADHFADEPGGTIIGYFIEP